MAFDMTIIHWATVADFAVYLTSHPRPAWCEGLCDHNTYRPDENGWQGLASMRSMAKTYASRGWTAGPHLFCAAVCPDPADRGVWQMTPLAHQGVHAGPCNSTHLGIEHVGDFQARPPTYAQWQLAVDVNVAICRAWRLRAGVVRVHKECMPDRVCPGQYFSANTLRADVQAALLAPTHGQYRVIGVPIYHDSQLQSPTGQHIESGTLIAIDATAIDNPTAYHKRAGHLESGDGFINLDGAEKT